MSTRAMLAALAAALAASACTPVPERAAQDYLSASRSVTDYQRGKQDLAAGNYGLALLSFTAAVRRDPGDIAARNGQAIALARLDRDDEAAAAFEQALQLDGRSSVTINNYANFLERHGGHARAVILLARRDAPTNAIAPAAAATTPVPVPPDASADTTIPRTIAAPLTISNGSGHYRLARRLQRYLSSHGIAAERVANAARFDRTQSLLFCHAQSRADAERIQRTLPDSVKLVVLSSNGNSIQLVAGSDLNNFDTGLGATAGAKRMVMR